MKRLIARRDGGGTDTSRDYEYPDWDAVDTFARGFLSDLVEQAGLEAAAGDPGAAHPDVLARAGQQDDPLIEVEPIPPKGVL